MKQRVLLASAIALIAPALLVCAYVAAWLTDNTDN